MIFFIQKSNLFCCLFSIIEASQKKKHLFPPMIFLGSGPIKFMQKIHAEKFIIYHHNYIFTLINLIKFYFCNHINIKNLWQKKIVKTFIFNHFCIQVSQYISTYLVSRNLKPIRLSIFFFFLLSNLFIFNECWY